MKKDVKIMMSYDDWDMHKCQCMKLIKYGETESEMKMHLLFHFELGAFIKVNDLT